MANPKTPEEVAAWRAECAVRNARSSKIRDGFRTLHESGWSPWDGRCRVWTCGDEVRVVTWAEDGTMTWEPCDYLDGIKAKEGCPNV